MNTLDQMQSDWNDFFARNKAQGHSSDFFKRVVNQYNIPQRYYHTFTGHISYCMEEFNLVRSLCDDPDLVYFALLHHDVIYDSKRKDNEEKSVEFASSLAQQMSLPRKFIDNCSSLILPTKHQVSPDSIDAMIVVDIDLSILGRSVSEFDAYENNIHQEYSWVPQEQFKQGRSAILQMFLKKAEEHGLYHTDYFKDKYESQAKINLKRSLDALK